MAIRMKEWGVLAAPGPAVRVPVQGLTGWAQVAGAMGKGLASALAGGTELAAQSRKVKRTGELAAFAERLSDIGAELGAELAEQPVQDWDYAWNAAASARYAAAVQELSPESREDGRELARLASAQASLAARRDRELGRIEQARSQWTHRVEAAVSAGDEDAAAEWMAAGRGVFVPEAEAPQRQQQVRSRACLARWQAQLNESPLPSLAALAAATPESLPQGEEEQRGLEQGRRQAQSTARRALAHQFTDSLRAGCEPDAATLDLACRAGLLKRDEQVAPARAATPDAATHSAWLRWIDERDDGDDADTERRLAIATAALPLALRARLLQRLDRSAQVPASDRRALSHRLQALYRSGALGCPGDAESQRALLRLQEEGGALLAEQGAGATAAWLRARQESAGRWVCFGDDRN